MILSSALLGLWGQCFSGAISMVAMFCWLSQIRFLRLSIHKMSHLSVFETESHNVSLAGLELTRYQAGLDLMESHVLPSPGIKVWATTAGSCFWGEIGRVLLGNQNLLAATNSVAPHNMSWALISDQFCPNLSVTPGWLQCMLRLLVCGDIWQRTRLGESQVYIWQKGLYFLKRRAHSSF